MPSPQIMPRVSSPLKSVNKSEEGLGEDGVLACTQELDYHTPTDETKLSQVRTCAGQQAAMRQTPAASPRSDTDEPRHRDIDLGKPCKRTSPQVMNQRLVNAVIRRVAYRTGRVGRPKTHPISHKGPGRGSTPGRRRLPDKRFSYGEEALLFWQGCPGGSSQVCLANRSTSKGAGKT